MKKAGRYMIWHFLRSPYLTVFLPFYLKQIGSSIHLSDSVSTAQWATVQWVSTAVVALLAPILGALSDFRGIKKIIFNIFFVISIVSLVFMTFTVNYNLLLIINFVVAIGYTGTGIIYRRLHSGCYY